MKCLWKDIGVSEFVMLEARLWPTCAPCTLCGIVSMRSVAGGKVRNFSSSLTFLNVTKLLCKVQKVPSHLPIRRIGELLWPHILSTTCHIMFRSFPLPNLTVAWGLDCNLLIPNEVEHLCFYNNLDSSSGATSFCPLYLCSFVFWVVCFLVDFFGACNVCLIQFLVHVMLGFAVLLCWWCCAKSLPFFIYFLLVTSLWAG